MNDDHDHKEEETISEMNIENNDGLYISYKSGQWS